METEVRTPQQHHPHSHSHPSPPPDAVIQIADDVESDDDVVIQFSRRRGDRNTPISVEDYDEDALLRRAIAVSLADVYDGVGVINVDCIVADGDDDVQIIGEDRKGKTPVKPSGRRGSVLTAPSVTEIGEPSGPPLLPTVLCAICMDAKLLEECSVMNGCSHLFCSDCVRQYVKAKLEENVTTIRCPQPGCKDGSLELEMCRSILPRDVFERWGDALCEMMIASEMRFYCPFKDCSALLIDEAAGGSCGDQEVIRHSECPHCYRMFCVQCRVPWHTGVTCEEFQKLGMDEREREDIMLMEMARKSKWQRCPQCKFYVERTEGCMFMQCRCGHRFCYGCASPMVIDHYCPKCRR